MKVSGDNIEIVLVGPQSAGNIGSTARVMMNTGLTNLVLVSPVEYANDEAWSRACNAVEILRDARVTESLEEALSTSAYVVATSRRRGKNRSPTLTLSEAVPRLLEISTKNKISILFGREDKGLSNDEISMADMVLEIPSDEAYPSLNLSHAVFAVAHSLFTAEVSCESAPMELARREDVLMMYEHLEVVLRRIGYGCADKGGEYLLRVIMRNSRRLFGRTTLMQKEVNMIRGILAKIEENTRD